MGCVVERSSSGVSRGVERVKVQGSVGLVNVIDVDVKRRPWISVHRVR